MKLPALTGIVLVSLLGAIGFTVQRLGPGTPGAGSVKIHSGWQIDAKGDTHIRTGDFLNGSAMRPQRDLVAFVSSGYGRHCVTLVDANTGAEVARRDLDKAWNGIAWTPDGKELFVSGGSEAVLHRFADAGARNLSLYEKLPVQGTAPGFMLAGMAFSPNGEALYVADHANDTVHLLDPRSGKSIASRKLVPESRPYCVRTAPDGRVYVGELSYGRVTVLDPAGLELEQVFEPGSHPNDLTFSRDGRLFVSCGSDDRVAVIDAETGRTEEKIVLAPSRRGIRGATPNALSLSPDQKTLYVALADANAVAVVDVGTPLRSHVKGYVPSAWYPTAVFATPNGQRLMVGAGKGMGTWASSIGSDDTAEDAQGRPRKFRYIATMFEGVISTMDLPNDRELASLTQETWKNAPYKDSLIARPETPRPQDSPIPGRVGGSSPIRHVLYILKENKTYDMYLGDLKDAQGRPMGNGDPRLTAFPEPASPNHHALAREFLVLDNLYCSGEVSGNGHPWSTGAYCTDLGERQWALDYGDKGSYSVPDRALIQPSGRIWDRCEEKGLWWQSYYWTWTTINTRRRMPAAWARALTREARDYELADVFIADLRKWEAKGEMPRFMMMSLREDHTYGSSAGKPTVAACIASNDLALGKIVDACSRSKFWKNMAIFVIQDDAQSGPDHVDAHRTTGYVLSPYTRSGRVVSEMYTTCSMLRTMELILGLEPMTIHDATAPVMYACFQAKPDLTPYRCRPAPSTLLDVNPKPAQAMNIDFSVPDRLTVKQELELNRYVWAQMKGSNMPYPAIVRRATFAPSGVPVVQEEE
jgi:DNA-binding beta-propeller fold protein YncE